MATLLDGKAVRDDQQARLKERFAVFERAPKLVIIQVGEREDTNAYVSMKQKMGERLGAEVEVRRISDDVSEDELLLIIGELNNTPGVDGLIVQLPLPKHLNVFRVIEAVDPEKDVDGLTAINVKKLAMNTGTGFMPATARGVMSLLDAYELNPAGRRAVVVGRSMLVGKPCALALLNRDATVSIAHSKTEELASVTSSADILVVAAGQPAFITAEHVRDGQTVIDVGINLNEHEHLEEEIPGKKFVGDVSYTEVEPIVDAITPVPGGVGPMTVVSLFENLATAVEKNQ